MKLHLLVLMILCQVSLTAFASVGPAQSTAVQQQEAQTVQDYTRHLNYYYSELDVRPKSKNSSEFNEVIRQLSLLEDALQGRRQLAPGSLTILACKNCACDGCAL